MPTYASIQRITAINGDNSTFNPSNEWTDVAWWVEGDIAGSDWIETRPSADQDEAWCHGRIDMGTSVRVQASSIPIIIYDDSGNQIVRVKNDGFGNFQAMYDFGGGWTNFGSTFVYSGGAANIDVHVKIDDTVGEIHVYYNDTLYATFNGDTVGSYTGHKIQKARYGGSSGTTSAFRLTLYETMWGEGDSPTNGLRVFCKAPTGNSGTNTAWTGDYTDVDEIDPLTPDANIVTTGSASQREGFTIPSLPSGISEFSIQCMGFSALAQGDGTRDFAFSYRLDSTDYDGSAVGLGLSQEWFEQSDFVNPDTASAWLVSDLSGAEFGVLSS